MKLVLQLAIWFIDRLFRPEPLFLVLTKLREKRMMQVEYVARWAAWEAGAHAQLFPKQKVIVSPFRRNSPFVILSNLKMLL